jgi:uncharacterized protein (TIGR00730 family)
LGTVVLTRVCVFCGSSTGNSPRYRDAAADLGAVLAADGIELVYGGGRVGLMGVVADAVLAAGGVVHGVIPHALRAKEVDHRGLTHLEVVDDMHQRKARMAELSDGFIALPGGLGTFEELLEQLTWAQLGLHAKPSVVIDVDGFYAPLLAQLSRAVDEGFMKPVNLELIGRAHNSRDAVDLLHAPRPPIPPKWIG